MWSGNVNGTIADIASTLKVGRVLDLGCGEGADAIWFAQHNWTTTAVDISTVAIERAKKHAQDKGVLDDIDFIVCDLERSFPAGEFDLVSGAYFHSPFDLSRKKILMRAMQSVAVDGHLLLVEHAAPPPWAGRKHHHAFKEPEETIKSLEVDTAKWKIIHMKELARPTIAPDGSNAVIRDGLILLKRLEY